MPELCLKIRGKTGNNVPLQEQFFIFALCDTLFSTHGEEFHRSNARGISAARDKTVIADKTDRVEPKRLKRAAPRHNHVPGCKSVRTCHDYKVAERF
jgi:hypothetical protein